MQFINMFIKGGLSPLPFLAEKQTMIISLFNTEANFTDVPAPQLEHFKNYLSSSDMLRLSQASAKHWFTFQRLAWAHLTVVQDPTIEVLDHTTIAVSQEHFTNFVRFHWLNLKNIQQIDYMVDHPVKNSICEAEFFGTLEKLNFFNFLKAIRVISTCKTNQYYWQPSFPYFYATPSIMNSLHARHVVFIPPSVILEKGTGNITELSYSFNYAMKGSSYGDYSGLQKLTIPHLSFNNISHVKDFLSQISSLDQLSVCVDTPTLLIELESLAPKFKECFVSLESSLDSSFQLYHPATGIWNALDDETDEEWRAPQSQTFYSVDALTITPNQSLDGPLQDLAYTVLVGNNFPNAKYIDCAGVPFALSSCCRQVIYPEFSSNLVTLSVTVHDAYASTRLFDLFEGMPCLKFLRTNFCYQKSVTRHPLIAECKKNLHCGVYDMNHVSRWAKRYLQSKDAYLLSKHEMQSVLEHLEMHKPAFKSNYKMCDLLDALKFPKKIVERFMEFPPMNEPSINRNFVYGYEKEEVTKVLESYGYLEYLRLETLYIQALLQQFFRGLGSLKSLEEVSVHGEIASLDSPWLSRLIHTSLTLKKITFSSSGYRDHEKGGSYTEIFETSMVKKREEFQHFISKSYIPQFFFDGRIRTPPKVFVGYVIDVDLMKKLKSGESAKQFKSLNYAVPEFFPNLKEKIHYPGVVGMDPAESFAGHRTVTNIVYQATF